jgi:hypothetical protein
MFSQHAYFLQDNKLKPDIKKMGHQFALQDILHNKF